MDYRELKENHSKRLNDFKFIFFAFNEKQFQDGIKKLNVSETEIKEKLFSIGSGGFILKEKSEDYKNIFTDNDRELKEFLEKDNNLLSAFLYELNNHEYGYTYDDEDTLLSLGLNKERLTENQLNIFVKAKKKYISEFEG